MTIALNSAETALLSLVQRDLPHSRRPFAEIGRVAGMTEAKVIAHLRDLRDRGVIRDYSALFDARALGYSSVLVAAEFPPDRLDAAAAIISAHPGVSHNYAREGHAFNLWFTLAIAPTSALGLPGTLEALARLTQAVRLLPLPALRTYKLRVHLALGSDGEGDAIGTAPVAPTMTPTDDDVRLIGVLQQPFPLLVAPFDALAVDAGMAPGQFFARVEELYARGFLRRIAAVLHHRQVGYAGNGMGVWAVPDDRVDALGAQFAQVRAVSHCYRRPRAPGWPYNLFAMLHAHDREECLAAFARMAGEAALPPPLVLFSTKEYKKARIRYFTDDAAQWEARCLNA